MKFQQIRNWILLIAWLCLAMPPLAVTVQQTNTPAATTAAAANATVVDIKGKVQVQISGQAASTPARGQVLPAETVVITDDGRILLKLEDGSEILVNKHTRLVLKQPAASAWQRLQLLLGHIKAQIQKRIGGSPPFQIGTPSAVISVRGTRFTVEVDKHNSTKVVVEEGEVQLESTSGVGKPVIIKAGQKSRVKEDSAPEPPQEAPEAGRQSGNNGNGRDNSPSGLGSHGNGSPGASHGGGRRP
jgi:hypothetical protein